MSHLISLPPAPVFGAISQLCKILQWSHQTKQHRTNQKHEKKLIQTSWFQANSAVFHRPVRLGCFRCGFVCGCFCVLMICKFDSPFPNRGLKRASPTIVDSAIHNSAIPIWLMSKCIQAPGHHVLMNVHNSDHFDMSLWESGNGVTGDLHTMI